jgi:2-dehydro-3-deoxygluconokinase
MRAVCIGECMVELAPAGGGLLRQGFAGDSFNTAWYLKRLRPDWAVDYLSAVGTDAISDEMLGFMAAAGIGTGHVQRRPDRTVGLYLITLKDGERSFSYWRGQSAARGLADDPAALARGLAGADLVMFSGITLAILPPEGRARLLAALTDFGGVVAFDPNMRARLWSGADQMRAAVMAAAGVADIVLPSLDEEAAVFGDTGVEAVIARYRGAGAGTVVVKNGAARLVAWDRGEGVVFCDPTPVVPVDTTAAGDSFNAGFLAARLSGAALGPALEAGAVLAARVVRHPGALVG